MKIAQICNMVKLTTQQQITSLQAALNNATSNGIKFNEPIKIGGWELILAPPRMPGGLPAVIHALPIE